jgi:GNAT superfamily N-acetyltransferase
MKLKIRAAGPEDHDFVVQSWLEYYKTYSQFGKSVPSKVFFREHRALIRRCLELAPCYVAVDSLDDSFILGFICMEDVQDRELDVLHFIFVRRDLRGNGIGGMLVDKAKKNDTVEFSHQGDIGKLWAKYQAKTYNPYQFFGVK